MMGGKSFRFSMFVSVLAIFCLLEVLTAEDVRPLQNSSASLKHVPAVSLDGHVELSTLDLLPTSAPSHLPPTRKTSKYVIKRPIHRNSSSKINRNESFPVDASTYPSSRVGWEKKSSIDGQVSTDISKAHSAGDERDNNHDKYDVEGGFSERKGSGATGNEQGDKDLLTEKYYDNLYPQLQEKDHRRKVLKQIKKRPSLFKHSTNLNSTAAESTTSSLEKEMNRRQLLKAKSPSENSKNGSAETTSLSSLSLILEAANGSSSNNRTSKFLHEIVITATEKSEDIEIDMSSGVYPEQDDQDIALFTQTGPEHDESLFEFTGSTEQDIFEIGAGSAKENNENPSEKYSVSLPKSFSEEYIDIDGIVDRTDSGLTDVTTTESTSTSLFDELSEKITLRNSNMVTTTVSSISLSTGLHEVNQESTTFENVVETTITTRLPEISTENDGVAVTQGVPNYKTSATDRVDNAADTINKVPTMISTPQDAQHDGGSTETTRTIFSIEKTERDGIKTEQTANKFPESTKEFESSSTPHPADTTTFGDERETTTSDSSKTFGLRNNASNIDAEDFITAFPNISQENHDTSVTSAIASAITEKETSTNSMLNSSIAEDNSVTEQTTTEGIVTIDPAHWYGISTGGDVIEVHPDTEKSENTTEVFNVASVTTEQQASTFSEKDSESSTNTMLDTFATDEKSVPFTTAEIVTVDPAQWYHINTGNGNIEVHPDTDKSENITEVFVDEQGSSEGDKMPVEAQAGVTPEVMINPDIWFRSNTSGISSDRPEHPEDSKVMSNNRSDKALQLDKTNFEYDIKVETATTTTSAPSTEITADHTTESRKGELMTQVSLTPTLLDQESLKLNGNSEHSDLDHIIANTIHEDKHVVGSNKEYGDVVEVTTIVGRAETDTINSSTQFTAIPGPYTSESNTEVPNTSIFTTTHIQYSSTATSNHISAEEIALTEGTTLKENTSSTMIHNEEHSTIANVLDTSTLDVIDSETSSHITEVSINTGTLGGPKKTTITSTSVEDKLPSVLIPNGELTENSTIVIDKGVPTRDHPKEALIPSLMQLWPISYKNILKIVESDETEQDNDAENINLSNEFTTLPQKSKVLSEKNGDERTKSIDKEVVSIEKELVLNQSKAVEQTAGHTFLCEDLFGNDSVFIAKNIIGQPTNVSIHIETEGESEYIPSDVYILEDLNHQLLNFTWKSSLERLNNSLALVLNYTKNLYVLSGIDLNIVKGGAMLNLKADITNDSQIYQKPEQCNFTINLSSTTKVTFSSMDFLKIQDDENAQKNILMGTKTTSEKHQKTIVHMEIVVGVIVIVVIILLLLYLLVEKHKRKTPTSDKSV